METDSTTKPNRPRALCAIGASAGGLEALKKLFGSMPNDTGLAFVVIQHLDPKHPSILSSVLASEVGMDAVEVTDGMVAQPNRIHVIPPAADLDIAGGVLALVPRQASNKIHLPIDAFFQALANDEAGKAIGVVLSGSAFDGTEGLRAIKRAGGITFAQSPESAQFRSMPESAVAAGVVDFCQTPEQIAQELVRLSRDSYLLPAAHVEADETEAGDDVFPIILAAINKHAQLDLRHYKRPTIERRVARRMALRGFTSLKEYAASLDLDAGESTLLAQEVLIHVTSFFRDQAAFQVLTDSIFPALLERTAPDAEIRIWNPGCATGQETYSLGICLLEALSARGRTATIKLFGSDLSDRAIETARAGLYSEADLDGVSPERRARFFDRVEGRYRISRQVRDQCVFVRHDLTRDPPFAKLDFIACRNVLIYFDKELQQRVVPLFHQCLNPQGILFLGSSEALSGFSQLFAPIDKQHRMFMKSGESQGIVYPLGLGRSTPPVSPAARPTSSQDPAREAQRQVDNILLSRYAPPGVVVNEALQVVQFRGRTGAYLEQPAGSPQMNVLNMAREGLVIDLRDALEKAKTERITVRKKGVRIIEGQVARLIDIEVVPLLNGTSVLERYFLVLFEAAATASAPSTLPAAAPVAPDEEVSSLRSELSATREYLRLVSSEYQDAMQELATGNEEMVAGNEELQSTNEELQSAKEELQSTNEELTTLNDELRSRNQELDVVANDIVNVLGSVQLPVILVDRALRIRRFTPTADSVAWLRPESIGRSIDEVKLKVRIDDLSEKIRETMATSVAKEWEVQDAEGRWLRLHIRPYETAHQVCEGAILSFVDVDVLRQAIGDAERARDYARGIIETVPMALIVLDQDLRVTSVNPPFYDLFNVSPAAAQGAAFFDLEGGACNASALREALEESLATHSRFRDLEQRCEFPDNVRRDLRFAGCPIKGSEEGWMLLLAIEDVTPWRHLEASQRRLRMDAVQANHSKDDFLATLAHELRGPLSTMLMSTELLKTGARDQPMLQRASNAIERAVANQSRLIEDLSDVSRIESGKLRLSLEDLDAAKIVEDAVEVAFHAAEAKGLTCKLHTEGSVGQVRGDSSRLQQVLGNLLTNAIKFTPKGGSIQVLLQARGPCAEISIKDDGLGISAELLPHIFDRFMQAETAMSREYNGLGLGLTIVRHLVQIHGGEVRVESPGQGKGTTFTVTLPLVGQPATASTV